MTRIDGGKLGSIISVIVITLLIVGAFIVWFAWLAAKPAHGDSAKPGEIITFWYAWGFNSTANAVGVGHANLFVDNGRPPVFVCSADVELPGQIVEWYQFGKKMQGVWLLNHQIGMPDGSVISDDCLPRLPKGVDSVGQLVTSGVPGPPTQGK
jgi:hypothetical protein